MKCYGHFLSHSKGNVAIEFALVLPVIFLLLSGVINFGLILANKNQLNSAVNAGLFYAYAHPSATTQNIIDEAVASTPLLTPLTVTVTQFCGCVDGSTSALPCTTACAGTTILPGTYTTVTAQSSVDLIALDFVLDNPFITSAQGIMRMK